MITNNLSLLSFFLLCLFTPCEPGLIPNPFETVKGLYFKGFQLPDFGTLFTDIPKHATHFIEKLIPQPIKNLLNFDPAPEWVPNPGDFQTELENEKMLNDGFAEEKEEEREDDDDGNNEDNLSNYEEKGNLHGIGRDVIRSLTNQFSNISEGLDTDRNFFTGLLNGFKDQVKAIFPGTQWCGDGNIARNKKDLGFFFKTDSCCREHDNCPDFIIKDESKYGLLNQGLFTRSNCECDTKFYDCLKKANDMISQQIGMAYFSVLGPQCYRNDYPIVECRIRKGLTNRCIEYELNNSSEKIYQWFDNREF